MSAIFTKSANNIFSNQHARLNRGVRALDPRSIEITRITTNQSTTRKRRFRQTIKTTCSDCTRAITNAFTIFKKLPNTRMRLITLKLLERREVRIFVTKTNHKAYCYLIVRHMVQKRTTISIIGKRPASGMHHETLFMHARINLP